MADTKEFESLDELFRKTFDNLPETPAQSGWDTPSERVWQHVQSQIKPPRSGWSTQTISLIAAFAVTLAVGLYLMLGRAEKPGAAVPTPPPVVAEEAAKPPVTNTVVATEEQPVMPKEQASLPSKSLKEKSGAAKLPAKEKSVSHKNKGIEASKADPNAAAAGSVKADDKKPVPPNTTERRKAELAKRAETAWKTPLQSLPQRWQKEVNIDANN